MKNETAQTALFTDQRQHKSVHVIGIGDAGCRAASTIWQRKISGVGVTCIDTDALSLEGSRGDRKILLGAATLHGFGSGGDTRAVAMAAKDQLEVLSELTSAAECVIVIAGLTGGTGSGASPVICDALKRSGKLVVAVPIAPLEFEPIATHLAASDTLGRLTETSDAVVEVVRTGHGSIDSRSASSSLALHRLFDADRNYIASLTTAISTIVNSAPDRCEANSGDLRAVLSSGTAAVFGSAAGVGHMGAAEAARASLDSALAETVITPGSRLFERAVVLIESGPDITVSHIATVTSLIEDRIGSAAELHTAVRRSRLLGSSVRVSFIGSLRSARRNPVATSASQQTSHLQLVPPRNSYERIAVGS